MQFFKRLAGVLRDKKGNALLIGAATMPLMIGAAGLGIDLVQISTAKRQLQRAADSASLAGAHALVQGVAPQASVTRALALNDDITLDGAPLIENAPSSGPYASHPRAVRVTVQATRPMQFLSYFVKTPPVIRLESTAAVVVDGEFCMLSLEDGDVPGITMGGSATVNLGCGMSTNSRAATAITAGGASSILATPVMAVGGVPPSSNYASGTTLIPYSSVQDDPFKNLPIPAPSGCVNFPSIGPQDEVDITTTTPGYDSTTNSICLNGLNVKGDLDIDLPQGAVIYINGGTLDFGSQANVSGTGMTFVLTSTTAATNSDSVASMDMNAGTVMNLVAPNTGPYKGVLFYQDPRATLLNNMKFNGHASSIVEGAFYFPRAILDFNGTAGMQTKCLQLVARRLAFSGNSEIQNTCPTGGGAHSFKAIFVRLVG